MKTEQERYLENMVAKAHDLSAISAREQGIMSLGQIIDALKAITRKYHNDDSERQVYFDFLGYSPKGVHSWRGIYSQLAIGVGGYDDAPTLGSLIESLETAVGKIFEGYKGGIYVMGRHTPVHVANHNECWNTGVIGVLDSDYQIILQTGYISS